MLPKGKSFNVEESCDDILMGLLSLCQQTGSRKLAGHTGNAGWHIVRKCRTFGMENKLRMSTNLNTCLISHIRLLSLQAS
jgi:hypothetical protein